MISRLLTAMLLLFTTATIWAGEVVDTQWVRRFNGPSNLHDIAAKSIAVDQSMNVYVTGACDLDYSAEEPDFATIKYFPDGDTAWIRFYNNSEDGYDEPKVVAVDESGDVYVSGNSRTSDEVDYLTIKYDPIGNQLWTRRYDGPAYKGEDHVRDMVVDTAGNIYVFGESDGGAEDDDYLTIKYLPDGDTAWIKRWAGPLAREERAAGIAVDDSGNVYVTGTSEREGTMADFATVKYDRHGNELWVRWYNGPRDSFDLAVDIALDDSADVYVTGTSWGENYYDIATVKYDSAGNEIWVRRYDGDQHVDDRASAITVDSYHNVYVTGSCDQQADLWPPFHPDYVTIKYGTVGDTAWIVKYDGPADESVDAGSDVAVDSLGNVYVTGWSSGTGGPGDNYDFATVKYDSLGDEMWVERYNGPPGGGDVGRAIAADESGRLYVAGYGDGDGTMIDFVTIKYIWSTYICGDADRSGAVDIDDAVYLIAYIFSGGPEPTPPEAGDADCSGQLDIDDAVYLIAYIFSGGHEPCDTDGDGTPDC